MSKVKPFFRGKIDGASEKRRQTKSEEKSQNFKLIPLVFQKL